MKGEGTMIERLLHSCPEFAGLPPDAFAQLADRGETVRAAPGELFLRHGEPGDAMYVIVSGRVDAVAEVAGVEHVITSFKKGQVIGELSLLADAPRAGSIRVVRETELFRIGKDDFLQLLEGFPEVALTLARTLARRLQRSGPSLVAPRRAAHTIAVVALASQPDQRLFPDALERARRVSGNVTVLRPPPADVSNTAFGDLLDAAERTSDLTLLVADLAASDQRWTEFCIRQADELLAVAAPDTPLPAPGLQRGLAGCELVFLGTPAEWTDVVPWLDALQASTHHFADASDDESLARLVRRTTGHSLGIVLSGGGSRAFAHIGVLEVLREQGLKVDRVGGASMGAFIAGLAALGMTSSEMVDVCREEFVRRKPFGDYRIPRVSLIRGVRGEAMLRRVFGDARIELLPLDTFCVSADLVTAEVVVDRRGELYRAVGTSMSLPGIAAPVADGGRLLVDGGVLNNLPVDVMAARAEGPVLAVNVMRPLSIAEAGATAAPKLPSILETLTRATALGSWSLAARTSSQAALVIAPELAGIGTFDWRHLEQAVESGREAATRALEDWRP